MDLYTNQLREFFQEQRNFTAHLVGSQRPLKRLTDEIDHLSSYVDPQSQDKLAAIRKLVVEKDRLDFAHVYLALTKAWQFVHVPVTYVLVVLMAAPCPRRLCLFIGGLVMRRPARTRSVQPPKAKKLLGPGSQRDRLAVRLALVTVMCLGSAFVLFKDTQFLMPGPLASAHGAIENCSACHTKSGRGKLSWTRGLVAGDPHADSKACLTCHKMPDTAFNAHSASAEVLKQSAKRLTKIVAATPAPQWSHTQSIAFPTHELVARGLNCASCHQEHQGVNFSLNQISNEKCRSCHVVKFDSFDGHHPKFENYPFKRRTRIVYDHAAHFGKHFPEVAEKHPARTIPDTCSSCHNSREDKRVMAVAPFEQACTACHLDQIIGKERVSGPKGIAFLTLPGLDLRTLKEKNASIGEWPDASEAELTPFMKLMIGRNERGRALIKTVDGVNLQDLSDASDHQIEAVTNLVWEIKGLFHALISGKASDVLADLNIGSGAKLSATLVADLTANMPRDVVISAQQQWLPNLAAEIADPRAASDQSAKRVEHGDQCSRIGVSRGVRSWMRLRKLSATSPEVDVSAKGSIGKRDPPVCTMRIFGQCLVSKGRGDAAEAAKAEADPEEAAAETDTADADGANETLSSDEQPEGAEPEEPAGETDTATAKADGGDETLSAGEQPEEADGETNTTNAKPDGGNETLSAGEPPRIKAANQTDDLLFPTADELRAIEAAEKAAQPEGAAGVFSGGLQIRLRSSLKQELRR